MIHTLRFVLQVRFGVRARPRVVKRIQAAVSQNKRRFIDEKTEFDLDLTYICDRVIAMATPSVVGAEYRNDIREVARFFASRHYGKFRVFNMCEHFEEGGNANYSPDLLYGQLQKLPFRDHNAPPLHYVFNFCRAAVQFLNENGENVVTIHCRGGKGRTGTMVCSLLLWTGVYANMLEATAYFSKRRTDQSKGEDPYQGITSPAQLRYVVYVERMLKPDFDTCGALCPPPVMLKKVVMRTTPLNNVKHPHKHYYIGIVVEMGERLIFNYAKHQGLKLMTPNKNCDRDVHSFEFGSISVSGDVTVRFYKFKKDRVERHNNDRLRADPMGNIEIEDGGKCCTLEGIPGRQFCFFTFHTAFEAHDVKLKKCDVDGAHHDKRFSDSFSVDVVLSPENVASTHSPIFSVDSTSSVGPSQDGNQP